MRVAAIRRYPVKCMGGEALASAELDARGLVGDRWFAVVDDDGHFASGSNTRRFRRRDAVFGFAAATGADGQVTVTDGRNRWPVGAAELDARLSEAQGMPLRVVPEGAVKHHDAGCVSLVGTATLAWCAERFGLDADPRRLRANLVVETDELFVEETWIGDEVTIGEVTLRVVQRVERCRTIDLAQDGTTGGGHWLKHLGKERDLKVAVYADVVSPGVIHVADAVVPEDRLARA